MSTLDLTIILCHIGRTLSNMAQQDPFTSLHNSVLEAIALQSLSGAELRVLIIIWRKTFGFQKQKDNISISQFMQMTGLSRQTIYDALSRLIEKKIVCRTVSKTWFCKDFMKLDVSKTVPSAKPYRTESATKSVSKTVPTKETVTKEISNTNVLHENADSHRSGRTTKPATSHSKKKPIVKKRLAAHSAEEYKSIISYAAQVQGLKLLGNYGKQMRFGKLLFDAGYTVADIHYASINMWNDQYWRHHPFDLANIYNNIHKYQQREVPLTKMEELIAKYDTPEDRALFAEAKRKMKSIGL